MCNNCLLQNHPQNEAICITYCAWRHILDRELIEILIEKPFIVISLFIFVECAPNLQLQDWLDRWGKKTKGKAITISHFLKYFYTAGKKPKREKETNKIGEGAELT